MAIALSVLAVGSLVEESISFSGVGELDLHDPAVSKGGVVDGVGSVGKSLVDLDDVTRDGRVQVGGGLDRLDGTKGRSSLDGLANRREVDKDNLSKGVSGVASDSDRTDSVINLNPLVSLGVLLYNPEQAIINQNKIVSVQKTVIKELETEETSLLSSLELP